MTGPGERTRAKIEREIVNAYAQRDNAVSYQTRAHYINVIGKLRTELASLTPVEGSVRERLVVLIQHNNHHKESHFHIADAILSDPEIGSKLAQPTLDTFKPCAIVYEESPRVEIVLTDTTHVYDDQGTRRVSLIRDMTTRKIVGMQMEGAPGDVAQPALDTEAYAQAIEDAVRICVQRKQDCTESADRATVKKEYPVATYRQGRADEAAFLVSRTRALTPTPMRESTETVRQRAAHVIHSARFQNGGSSVVIADALAAAGLLRSGDAS